MNWQALRLTAELASLTSLVLMVVGIPVALWVTFSRRRWKFLAESVVALHHYAAADLFWVFTCLLASDQIAPWGAGTST